MNSVKLFAVFWRNNLKKFYKIGEFSRITGLTVQALRHYQSEGLLSPDWTDDDSSYRYYSEQKIPEALLTSELRNLGFSIPEIQNILLEISSNKEGKGDIDIQKERLKQIFINKIHNSEKMILNEKKKLKNLKRIIESEFPIISENSLNDSNFGDTKLNKTAKTISDAKSSISIVTEHKTGPGIILSHRFKGQYQDVGRHFGRLYKLAGWNNVTGNPGCFYYDDDYKDDDADIECFIFLKKKISSPDTSFAQVRDLPEMKTLSIIHTGSYDLIGNSYKLILNEIQDRNLKPIPPSGEIFIKGPGMILRGNPDNYITRIFYSFQ
jgi:DNA-binding transcriptional MerR regulator/effector-binding domain-containing protein